MPDFEAIRPYRDDEVPTVLSRLLTDDRFIDAAAAALKPRVHTWVPLIARLLIQPTLQRRLEECECVHDVQMLVGEMLQQVIENSTHGFTYSGIERLSADENYLFIGNHRDIVLDSSLLNVALHESGHATSRIAVGDNLLTEPFAADLIRLNKCFVVERDPKGTKETFKSLSRTSAYIRQSLEDGHSVWIAQAQGRAKDGADRTEPAVLKMLMLAYRKELQSVDDYLERVRLVPVTVTYELDPCDTLKAQELAARAEDESYEKDAGEDLASIGTGIRGQKGRVHLQFGRPQHPAGYEDTDALALALDDEISRGVRVFPTHIDAARRLGQETNLACDEPVIEEIQALMDARVDSCDERERELLLNQYANIYRSAADLVADVNAVAEG